ncbi:MAG: ABC transporter permease [Verrucomicrobia bacterium]|nr:ABC transporter permease [Verrucomicrobiota bacterium]
MKLLSEFKEGVWISLDAVRANKMRSILATLGIVIGVVTVTLMGTAIGGVRRAFLKSISAIGGDVLYVSRRSWFIDSEAEWIRTQKRPRLNLTQTRMLKRQFTSARAIAPVVDIGQTLKVGNRESMGVHIIGTTDEFQITSGVAVAQGRFLSPGEVEGGRPVCVIGLEVATNFFPNISPLGQKLRIGSSTFEVVGVLEKQGSFLGMVSLDNQAIIPIQTLVSSFWNDPDCTLHVKALDIGRLEETKEELRGAMRKIRRLAPSDPDDFAINQQEMFVKMFNRVVGTIGSVGLFITGLSLFVGGIGIMNIMFVSVAERTREIGIRKAIGAKRRTILLQFLIEAASICLLGGLVALAIAFPLTLVMGRFLPATLSLPVAGLALAVSLVTGLASGFFPAWRAARMNPVDALRNE